MDDIDLLAIDGLDAAIVGSAMVDGQEVLIYDFDKCVEVIIGAGSTIEYAEEYVLELSMSNIKGIPIFVNFDNNLEYYGESPSIGATIVHWLS